MAIIRRSTPSDNFTIISNGWLRDKRLSWKARGLLCYLASHSIGWATSTQTLVSAGPDGRDAVGSGLRELVRLGYLVRTQSTDDEGHFGEVTYDLHDPLTDYPLTGYPLTENPPHKNTITQEHQEQEDQGQQQRGRATSAQREFLEDLHVRGGGVVTAEFRSWLDTLSITSADAEIREARRVLERIM